MVESIIMYQKKYNKNIVEALDIALDRRDKFEIVDILIHSLFYNDLISFRSALRVSSLLKENLKNV